MKKETPQDKYQRNNCKMITLKLVKSTESDIINKLESVSNKSGYIKNLIRKDISEETKQKETFSTAENKTFQP
ncbi:MAG: hypothetical protein NC177_17935 [Ruminococcus flavefaciens]|nr:hypothetical protein [Ruminococcus flavefaciens]